MFAKKLSTATSFIQLNDAAYVLTSKKRTKLWKTSNRLAASDDLKHACGKSVVSRPPVGKTMVKQLFAGQLGLTYLCAMFLAWPCGRPLDLQYGWDADSRAGIAQVHLELQS